MSQKKELLNDPEYINIFRRLNAIASTEKASRPFLPFIPDSWEDADSQKIMWCGAATNGWVLAKSGDETDLVSESKENDKWLKNQFSNRPLRSQFWRVQKKSLATLSTDWNKVVWQNMYKIGGVEGIARGMPPNGLQKAQAELCLKAFKIELKILKPILVVLHVGFLVQSITEEIGKSLDDGWHDLKSDGKYTAAYGRLHGTNLIWLSRRSASDALYSEYFATCCNKLGV